MLTLNLFIILTALCARVTSLEILGFISEIAQQNPLEEAADSVLEVILPTKINSTGAEKETAESREKDDCAGGLLDFIQCVVRTKIETFRLEHSKVEFPDKPPAGHEIQTIDSKIEDSLANWIQKFIKSNHSGTRKENCTCDK